MRLYLLVLSLSSACAGGKDSIDACAPGPDPTLQIGLGLEGYSAITDGEFPLVHGPQGGYHLEIGLRLTHLDTSDLVTGHLEGSIDGVMYADTDPWLDFRCDEAEGALISWGTRLIYDSTPTFLDSKVTTIEASVTDLDGNTVSTSAAFTIRDAP